MRWSPILDGERRARASTVLDELAAALAPDRAPPRGGDLAAGDAGLALLFAYLARSGRGDAAPAELLRDRALDDTAGGAPPPDLFGGFTGVAWVTDHLADPDDPDDVTGEIAAILRDHVARDPWRGDFDLIRGLVGYGVYALEALHRPGRRELLAAVVERLHDTAVPVGAGLAWLTRPEHIEMTAARAANPDGWFDAGLAHGVPAVIALLARAVAADVAAARAAPLLDGAVAWLRSLRAPTRAGAQLPAKIPAHAGAPAEPGCRLAWCYGDAGVAIALLGAARAVGERAWEDEALAIARAMATRDAASALVRDAGLCHGAAGLAHIFNRLWQATGEPALHAAALRWFDATLALHGDAGPGGYRAWAPGGPDFTFGWTDDPGLLTGSAGVALALLAAITADEPRWDRVLLTDLP